MMWNNDDFSPETVDEQIERFVEDQSDQRPNAVLTRELESMCEEDRAILERSWARYAARLGIWPTPDAQPSPGPSQSSRPDVGAFSAIPAPHQVRPPRRAARVLALVAALLVAAVLVGSALWAARTLRQPGLTATPQPTRTHAPTPTSTVVTPALAPSGRANTQLVYDDATSTLLLFSGQDYTGAAPLTDTWAWSGSAWTQMHPVHHPSSRTSAAIAYDPATRQVVLFGGDGITSFLDDTWIWNGSDWTQQHPASSPPARVSASMAYDVESGQLVLFGGKNAPGFNTPDFNDTWIWTGSNWVQQHPVTSPPARTGAALAYDAASGQLVLFGGDLPTGYGVPVYDTWIWTGSNWVQQHPANSPPTSISLQGQTVTLEYPSMVYNPATGQLMLMLIGQGANDGTHPDFWTQTVWAWSGNNWAQVTLSGPFVESGQLFYDAHLHAVFELTDFIPRTSADVENKLWKWTGQTWALVESW